MVVLAGVVVVVIVTGVRYWLAGNCWLMTLVRVVVVVVVLVTVVIVTG